MKKCTATFRVVFPSCDQVTLTFPKSTKNRPQCLKKAKLHHWIHKQQNMHYSDELPSVLCAKCCIPPFTVMYDVLSLIYNCVTQIHELVTGIHLYFFF